MLFAFEITVKELPNVTFGVFLVSDAVGVGFFDPSGRIDAEILGLEAFRGEFGGVLRFLDSLSFARNDRGGG